MKKYTIVLTAGLAMAAGCIDNTIVTPENAPTVDALSGDLTGAGVKTLALGVLAQDRSAASGNGYTLFPEIYGRNAYRIDSNEPRYVLETFGPADPGSFAAGGTAYTSPYIAIRAATSLLAALPKAVESQVSPAQNKTTAGLIQTIKALNYYRVLETRDTIGVPIQDADAAKVAPLSCKATVLTYIAGQLDSANTSLVAAGSGTLPFAAPTGFSAYGRDYNKASNLILLNRGLRGKVELYRGLQHTTPVAGAFANAITLLTQALGGAAPGAVAPATFATGAYVTYVAGGTENTPNPLVDSKVGVNPKAQAALQAGDTRASKIITRSTLAGQGLSTTYTYVGSSTANSANLTLPRAILRDEELVLLRAQAYFENAQFAQGTLDLNSVRTNYGLAPIAVPATLAAARDAVLYEKRFSLFFEGPQRLVDLRAYGLLKAGITPAEPIAGATDVFNTAEPIPKAEADARGNNLTVQCP
ncbi:hypothetical protein BH09GEM1_BH09GEM1_44240 [soil metagenome]